MSKKVITIAVVALVLLSGCSMLNPDSNNTDTQPEENHSAVLQTAAQSHLDASTVVVDNTIDQQFTISGAETIETRTTQETNTVYNISDNSYHTQGTLTQTRNNSSVERPINSYLVDGTYYTEVQTQNGSQWVTQNETFSRDLLVNLSAIDNPGTLEHFESSYNDTTNQYVYTADLTEDATFDEFFPQNTSWLNENQYGWLINSADTFTLTIVVSDDKTIDSVTIELESDLTYEELSERDTSVEIPENTTLDVSFTASQDYSEYNESQPITVPENATA